MKTKKIIIALDYNPTAQDVAEKGYSLAKTMNAEVVLLHILSDAMYYLSAEYSPIMGFQGYMNISSAIEAEVKDLKEETQNFLNKTKSHLGDESIKTIIETGDAAETILKTASDLKADLIVIGSLSRKWLENLVMGSVTEKVLRNTEVPLYIIPTKQKK